MVNRLIAGGALLMMIGMTGPLEGKEINSDLMDRDLRIMEGVLAEILDVDTHDFAKLGAPGVEGAYFDGYGVLFLTEAKTAGRSGRTMHSHAGFVSIEVDADSSAAPMDIVKDRLTEFFQNYAGAIRQVSPNQRVAVRVNRITSRHPFQGAVKIHVDKVKDVAGVSGAVDLRKMAEDMKRVQIELEREGKHLARVASRAFADDDLRDRVRIGVHEGGSANDAQLMAWITKQDLDKYQGTDTLRQKIQFEHVEQKPHKDRAIRVFSGILDTALGHDRGWFGNRSRTSGFYQKGVGSVFFLEHDLSGRYGWVPDHYNAGLDLNEGGKGSFGTMQALIGQVVAEYGSTIRSVRADEHIVINVKLRNPRGKADIPSRAVLRVKKDLVDRVGQGKMSFQDFMGQLEWQTL